MRKIYNAPALLVVELRTVHMMAESLVVSSEETIQSSEEILTKEQNMGNGNIWDNKW